MSGTERLMARAAAEPDEEARWAIVRALQLQGDAEVLAAARHRASGADSSSRVLAADVLNQFRGGGPGLHAQAVEVLAGLCSDADPTVLAAAGVALAHEGDIRALPALLAVQAHVDVEMRERVATSLPSLLGQGADEPVIAALIELSTDPDGGVRDWATFGLMRCAVGNQAVGNALAVLVDDIDDVVAAQAVLGLARAGDERAVGPLLAQLRSPRLDDWGSATYTGGYGAREIIEAAATLADPRLHGDLVLLAFDRRWDAETRELLATAVERTRPAG